MAIQTKKISEWLQERPTSSAYDALTRDGSIALLATADQGAKADTALQLGEAATPGQGEKADTALQPGEAATPEQGAKADTALQPGQAATVEQGEKADAVYNGTAPRNLGAVVASASTINLDAVVGEDIDISGTTTITAVTLTQGCIKRARATGAFQITASASLIVNGSTTINYTTAAGDLLFFEGYGSNVVQVWVIGSSKGTFQSITLGGQPIRNSASGAYTSSTTLSTTIPYDDTIPTSTEGTEILAVTLAASSASAKVRVEFNGWGTASSGGDQSLISAFFLDSETSARRTAPSPQNPQYYPSPMRLVYEFTPGDTASHTYRIRVGAQGGTGMVMNGSASGGRDFGGTSAATLTVTEV